MLARRVLRGAARRLDAWRLRAFIPADRAMLTRVLRLYVLLLRRLPDAGELGRAARASTTGKAGADVGRLVTGGVGTGPEPTVAAADAALLPLLFWGGVARIDDPWSYRWWLDEYEAKVPVRPNDEVGGPLLTLVLAAGSLRPVRAAVQSVLDQDDAAIEVLVLVPHGMVARAAAAVSAIWGGDGRVRVVAGARGAAWPLAAEVGRGRYVGVLEAGTRVAAGALAAMADAVAERPSARILYGDHDRLDWRGRRWGPVFQGAWDPERPLGGGDLGPLTLYRRDLVQGLASDESLGAAGLLLRLSAGLNAADIVHCGRVVGHRRTGPVRAAGRRRLAASGRVVHALPTSAPLVSIIVPTRDRLDLLQPCLHGLLTRTDYPAMQIVVVDNGSEDAATLRYLRTLARDRRCIVTPCPGDFNWGALNNAGARLASGEILVLLNNDIEVLQRGWLDELARQAMRPEVGAVGAKLLYPDGRLQHGGMIVGADGSGRHVMRHAAAGAAGYDGMLARVRTVSAVTGACLATRRAVYWEVGGIEQADLAVTCSDVDYCLRVRGAEYRVVWTPYARLMHRELASRGGDAEGANAMRARREQAIMAARWASMLERDPYWSDNLTLDEDYPTLAMPPRRRGQRAAAGSVNCP